ncbi:MAG TPA: porin family protein [Chitinophagaceae bacterium]
MKSVFFVTALLLGVFIAGAQNLHPHVEFGVKGGLDVSNVHEESSTNPDSKASGYFGILAHIHLMPQFALQPELLFSGQGYSHTIAGTTYRTSLNYVTLPLLVQFMFDNGFRIETGPQPGVLVAAHLKSGGNSADEMKDFRNGDFSWVFGAGYLTRSGFGIDVRYNLGLTDITMGDGNNMNNRVFAVGAFYQFKHL